MGSIPVRSTRKWRMQSCIRHFFALFRESVLGSSIRQSRILAEGLPLAGNGKFPFYQIFLRLSFAGQFPLAGNSKFPSDQATCSLFFSRRTKRLAVFFSPVGRNDLQSFFRDIVQRKNYLFLRIGNKVTVNFERYRRIAMSHIFAHGLNRNVLR